MERFDSAALFSIFKNDEGENLLPFDEMAALLDLGDLDALDAPLTLVPPIVTTEAPAAPLSMKEEEPAVVPTGSRSQSGGADGGAESDHTRAQGWGSMSSDGDGDGDGDGKEESGGDSGNSDMDEQGPGDAQPTSTQTTGGGATSRRSRRGQGGKASSGVNKRRQRNADQMESNRVAQQKYRQRKKQEQNALQQAVDLLTAQVAALKAVEVRAAELEAVNTSLRATVDLQGGSITALQAEKAVQAAEQQATRAALSASHTQLTAQGRLIVDQQAKLRLQEQVIAALKDRLKERIDEALLHVVPGTVCEKMVAAVKTTLYGAKDVNGLQEILTQLPEHLVTELCKNIFHVCKETWPELRLRCSQQVGGTCTTGAV